MRVKKNDTQFPLFLRQKTPVISDFSRFCYLVNRHLQQEQKTSWKLLSFQSQYMRVKKNDTQMDVKLKWRMCADWIWIEAGRVSGENRSLWIDVSRLFLFHRNCVSDWDVHPGRTRRRFDVVFTLLTSKRRHVFTGHVFSINQDVFTYDDVFVEVGCSSRPQRVVGRQATYLSQRVVGHCDVT